MAASLRFTHISRHFGRVRVLQDVSGAVNSGEIMTVEGGNGSGKSTLLRCVAGLLRPQKGKVALTIDEREIPNREFPQHLGWIAPDLALYDNLSVEENLDYFAQLRRVSADDSHRMAQDLNLPPRRLVGNLSSGMRQKLRWCWALQAQPSFLLLDEPFQNLDAGAETNLRKVLEGFLHRGGAAMVASPIALKLPRVASRVVLAS